MTLGLSVFVLAPIMAEIPVAALVGLITLIALNTFAWSSITLVLRISFVDAVVVVLVTVVTVWHDLCVAVVIGTIVAALKFAWKQASSIKVNVRPAVDGEWKQYRVVGPLFFASTQGFSNAFSPKEDEGDVIIDFLESRVCDHSALEAINTVAERYGELGKNVHLRHLSSDCASLLEKLNGSLPRYEIIELDPTTDPVYEVADDSPLVQPAAA